MKSSSSSARIKQKTVEKERITTTNTEKSKKAANVIPLKDQKAFQAQKKELAAEIKKARLEATNQILMAFDREEDLEDRFISPLANSAYTNDASSSDTLESVIESLPTCNCALFLNNNLVNLPSFTPASDVKSWGDLLQVSMSLHTYKPLLSLSIPTDTATLVDALSYASSYLPSQSTFDTDTTTTVPPSHTQNTTSNIHTNTHTVNFTSTASLAPIKVESDTSIPIQSTCNGMDVDDAGKDDKTAIQNIQNTQLNSISNLPSSTTPTPTIPGIDNLHEEK